MLQIAYVSASTDTAPNISVLSRQAFARNTAEEVTGAILHRNGHFLHVLEGPKETVENAFLRIIADDRHEHLQLLSRRMVTSRHFGNASMAIVDSQAEQNDVVDHVRDLMTDAPPHVHYLFEACFSGGA